MQLPTQFQTFIHQSRYARWRDDLGRRETWKETVARYFDFMQEHLLETCDFTLAPEHRAELENAVLSLEVMPSMRCLMTAGEALKRDNVAGYNCSYIAIDSPRAFDESLYVLMCGTGVGFSCESRFVGQLPVVPSLVTRESIIFVDDSKQGWAEALRLLIEALYEGDVPGWDVSQIRPAGARLKTFGGRASGPDPLASLFEFTIATFRKAQGRKLTPLECHDLMCKIGEVVVVGGVRRSALISLQDLNDNELRDAKAFGWWNENPHRALSNNSAVYEGRPERAVFDQEWAALVASGSGERGIFNREAARVQAAKNGRRDDYEKWGCNPCSEIVMRSAQFCNLSEAVCRENDTMGDLMRKVRLATILGTFQSTLTHFSYLRPIWRQNTEAERLLGVSLTGIMDCDFLRNCQPIDLEELRQYAVAINAGWAYKLGIPQSTAITCVKPSGTVSSLVNSASGIHTRHSAQYIRTVRGDKKDPLTQFLQVSGVPSEDCVSKPNSTTVFSFPIKSPQGAPIRDSFTAIEQLETWLKFQRHWCEHKPSVTISVRENEWEAVKEWVWAHFDELSGVSFLPHSEHTYQQAPYQECTSDEYFAAAAKMPSINWEGLRYFESDDNTAGAQTLACSGGSCEVVDITT